MNSTELFDLLLVIGVYVLAALVFCVAVELAARATDKDDDVWSYEFEPPFNLDEGNH